MTSASFTKSFQASFASAVVLSLGQNYSGAAVFINSVEDNTRRLGAPLLPQFAERLLRVAILGGSSSVSVSYTINIPQTSVSNINATTAHLSSAVSSPTFSTQLTNATGVAVTATSASVSAPSTGAFVFNAPFPTSTPSAPPSSQPSRMPTNPTSQPSISPTMQPSSQPSMQPTTPTGQPTSQPSNDPTATPSKQPTSVPSTVPSAQPSFQPSSYPTCGMGWEVISDDTTQNRRQDSFSTGKNNSALPHWNRHNPNCQPCPRGYFQPSAHQAVCLKCEIGYYSDTAGSDACTKCPYPFTNFMEGQHKCMAVSIAASSTECLGLIIVVIILFVGSTLQAGSANACLISFSIMMFPAVDIFSDILYVMTAKFFNWKIAGLAIFFIVMPNTLFVFKLYEQRAWPNLFVIPYPGHKYTDKKTIFLSLDDDNNVCVNNEPIPGAAVILYAILQVLNIMLATAWACFNIVFVLAPLFCLGIFFFQTKVMAVIPISNFWYGTWTGKRASYQLRDAAGNIVHVTTADAPVWRWFTPGYWKERYFGKNAGVEVDPGVLNESLFAEFCLETIPQLILQLLNNYFTLVKKMPAISIVSTTLSVVIAANGVYFYLYWILWRGVTFDELPTPLSVDGAGILKVEALEGHTNQTSSGLKNALNVVHSLINKSEIVEIPFENLPKEIQTRLTEQLQEKHKHGWFDIEIVDVDLHGQALEGTKLGFEEVLGMTVDAEGKEEEFDDDEESQSAVTVAKGVEGGERADGYESASSSETAPPKSAAGSGLKRLKSSRSISRSRSRNTADNSMAGGMNSEFTSYGAP